MFTPAQIKAMEAPLNPANVKEREQGRSKLSYIEGWHAINEANRIFGFGNWERATVEMKCVVDVPREVGKHKDPGFGVSYLCKVRVVVRVGSETVIREGTGAGHGIDRDQGLAHESAAKEAETDAMKRALMTFGNPFGLALYDKTQANVCAPPAEPSEAMLSAIASADACTTKAELRAWWKSAGPGLQSHLDHGEFEAVKAHVVKRGQSKDFPETDQSEPNKEAT